MRRGDHSVELGNLQAHLAETDGSLHECESVLVEQEQLLERKDQAVQDLELKVAAVSRKCEELKAQLRRRHNHDHHDSMKGQLEATVKERDAAKSALSFAENAKRRLKESTGQLTKQLADAHEVEAELGALLEEQHRAVDTLKDELHAILDEKDDMERDFCDLMDEKDLTVNSMKEELLVLTQEKQRLTEEKEEHTHTLTEHTNNKTLLAHMEHEIKTMSEERHQLQEDLTTKETALTSLKLKISTVVDVDDLDDIDIANDDDDDEEDDTPLPDAPFPPASSSCPKFVPFSRTGPSKQEGP